MFSLKKRRSSTPSNDPSTSLHNSPLASTQRANCLALARKYLSPSARKVKVMKRRRGDGSSKVYTAFVVAGEGAEERVLINDWKFHSSEEVAVRRLSVMVVEEWRERQGVNFF